MTVGHGCRHVYGLDGPRTSAEESRGCAVGSRAVSYGWLAAWLCWGSLWASPCFGQTPSGPEGLTPDQPTPLTSSTARQDQAVPQTTAVGDQLVECELRIVWGGDTPRAYAGSIRVDSGVIKPVRNLSLQADSIGSQVSSNLQTIELKPTSASLFGGVDVSIKASPQATLTLTFIDGATQTPGTQQLTLAEVLQGTWIRTLDERGNRVAIERQLHDRLRISGGPEHGIATPGQSWPMSVQGYRCGVPAGLATLETRVVQQGQVIGKPQQQSVTVDALGNFVASRFEVQAPAQEGAYVLEISLTRRGYWNSLVSTSQPLVRRWDLVVFDPEWSPQVIERWQPLARIDPLRASKPGSLAWLSAFDVLTPLGWQPRVSVPDKLQTLNPLAGTLAEPISHGSLGARTYVRYDQVAAQSTEAECLTLAPQSWLAIPLSGLSGDAPHRLRVRAPTDRPMELALSIQQTNVIGDFPALNLDSGIIVGPRQTRVESPTLSTPQAGSDQANSTPAGSNQTSRTQSSGPASSTMAAASSDADTEHEIIFWPRGDQAYLLLANMHRELVASVADIQLERAELGTAAPQPAAHEFPARRMVGINLDKPLLADCVSAKREADPLTRRPLESWSTWQESISRICQLMQAGHCNTLVVKCFSEGGGLLPSPHLQPTCRYDNGTFFSDGRRPEIKDAVELMLRHFDRQQLHLVLALDLNTPLPGLQRLEGEAASAGVWQQPLGLGATAAEPERAQTTPRYNPLNARVQEELIATLRDIVARYGHHPAFAGIAIQLDNQSHLIFSGDRWGYDEQTLAEFERFAQLKLPPREQLETIFNGTPRLAFMEWRATELTKFYARLGEVVSAGSSQRKLYLNAIRLWDTTPAATSFVSPDAIIRNPREYMLAFGISPERLAAVPYVELMRGSFELMNESVNAQDWIRHESGQRGLVEFFAGADTSAMILRYPRRQPLQDSYKLDASASSWLYPTLSLPGYYARKRMVDQIFHSDPLLLVEGGWLPFNGQNVEVGELLQTLSEFPPLKLTAVAGQATDTNLLVRQGRAANKSYVQIINNASWTEQVQIVTATSSDSPPRILGGRNVELVPQSSAAGWSLKVAPYDMVGLEFADPRVTVQQVIHAPLGDTLRLIRQQLEQIDALVSHSADLAQQKPLANLHGDFEQWDEKQLPLGWNGSTLPQVSISRSQDLPHSGNASLLLENRSTDNVSAWIHSRPVKPPQTGRLAVQAWLRAPAVGPPLLVKLSVIGRHRNGDRFERALTLGSRSDSGTPIAIDWGRKPATLFVGDVSDETLSELTVSIELIGPGKVWVDDVQIWESLLQPDERNHLRGQLLVAQQSLNANNPFPAEQLLDSHWGEYLLRRQLSGTAVPAEANATPAGSWDTAPSVFKQLRDSLRSNWKR